MGTTSVIAPLRLAQAAVIAVAMLVGVVAGLSPMLGLALAVGMVYLIVVIQELALGLAIFVGVTFLESIEAFESLSLAKAAGALLAFSWIALVATDRDRTRKLARDHPAAATAMIALGAWATISVGWAEFPGAALDGAQRWILNLTMFPIVYAAVREPRHIRWVFSVFVLGALFSATQGVLGGAGDASGAGRLEGNGVNANELGELLIVAVILAGGLAACRELPSPARVLAGAGAGLSVIALLMTVSRGAMLGLLVALLVTPILIGRGRRLLALGLVLLAAGGSVGYLVYLAPPENLERITRADRTGTGRTDIWKLGVRIVKAKPVAGVGAGQYPTSTIHYLLATPGTITRSDFIIDDPKAAHNVYLQVLAELGAVGFAFYVFVLGFALVSLLRAAAAFQRLGERSLEILSRALLIGLCGLLASAFFSTAVYSKQLWLLLGLAVAISAMARERGARLTG